MKIDLKAYFQGSPDEYCVLRMGNDFPQCKVGSDLDILCGDIDGFVEYTLRLGIKHPEMRFRVKKTSGGHTHVDALVEKKLHFRFDFIDSLQLYKKFVVDEKLMDAVMANRVRKQDVWVPSEPYDLALRYMEYIERPRKTQHLHYVEARSEIAFRQILMRHTSLWYLC